MTGADFVHLHNHTEFSLLDGACRVKDLVQRAADLGMPAVALTDHGVMYGTIEFYNTCKKAGIKPILGCEVYVAPRGRTDRDAVLDREQYHLVLLAENLTGYRNLMKLVSVASLEGFYYKPRVDRELLAEYNEGLIAASACLGGQLPSYIVGGDMQRAREHAGWMAETFAGRYYLELQDHGIPEQRTANEGVIQLSRELNLPLIVTNDLHYFRKEDAQAHDVLLCIQTNTTVQDEKRMRFHAPEFYFKDIDEMARLFPDHPEAMLNTVEIAERCNVELNFKTVIPHYDVPPGFTYESYLEKLCRDNISRRYRDWTPELEARLRFELDVIQSKGFSAYFLIVDDFVRFARSQGILAQARGSAAGCMVTYLLGISSIDPIGNDLMFERFLRIDGKKFPDIDVDFEDMRRDEVLQYVVRKYGAECVAQIVTFGTLGPKAAVRDAARALQVPRSDVDRICKLIPTVPNSPPLAHFLDTIPEIRSEVETNPQMRELFATAQGIEGLCRHSSTHAAGVVISKEPLDKLVPLQRTGDSPIPTTQFDFRVVEEIGLLKMDFLGLAYLTVVNKALHLIEQTTKKQLELEEIPLDDERTYQMLGNGDAMGVFQVESSGMRQLLRDLRPRSFPDVAPLIALYRPGPLQSGMVNDFIARRHGRAEVEYPHPMLEPVLKDTYGIILYQEHVMKIAMVMGGFNAVQAEALMKAMSKKQQAVMDKNRPVFVEGAESKGVPKKTAEHIYELMANFAKYGFNKCLAGDTQVLMADGRLRRIADICTSGAAGEIVTLGDDMKLRHGAVTGVHENGVKDVFWLRTRSGRRIKATGNHPFLTMDGWTLLEQLAPGNHIALPRTLPLNLRGHMPAHELALLGYVVSEGNTCHPGTFYYYTSDREELDDYLSYLRCFEGAQPHVDERRGRYEVRVVNSGGRQAPNAAKAFVERMGLSGCKAAEKRLPDEVFSLCHEDLALLLGKLWVGDGCIDTRNHLAYYATSSEALARQVQHLLLRLGILSALHEKAFKYRGGVRKGYTVHVTGQANLRGLARKLGPHFVGPRARDLQRLCEAHGILREPTSDVPASGTRDVVPYAVFGLLRQEAAAHAPGSMTRLAAAAGVSERNFWHVDPARKKGYRRETLARIADHLHSAPLDRLARSDVYWDEIVAIEPAGSEMTYDLTVDGTHNFVAEDIIVHNSHSAAYALLMYQTAYLKCHYPVQYLAALMTAFMENKEKVVTYVDECRHFGIEVLPPDINSSQADFSVEPVTGAGGPETGGAPRADDSGLPSPAPGQHGFAVRFGMAAIKNVGRSVIEQIVAEREKGPFRSLHDFCSRIGDCGALNRAMVDCLIRAGAFDFVGARRAQLVAALDGAIALGQRARKEREVGQFSMLDLLNGAGGDDSAPAHEEPLPDVPEFSRQELLSSEKDLLGFYLTDHPVMEYRPALQRMKVLTTQDVADKEDKEIVRVGGIISKTRRITTRKGDPMMVITLEDWLGSIEVIIWPSVLQEYGPHLQQDTVVVIDGKASCKDSGRDAGSGDSEEDTGPAPSRGQVEVIAESIKPVKAPSGGDEPAPNGAANGNGYRNGNGNGYRNGNGHHNGNGNGYRGGVAETAEAFSPDTIVPEEPATPQGDPVIIQVPRAHMRGQFLRDLHAAVLASPGSRRLLLRLEVSPGDRYTIECSGIGIQPSPDLVQRVREILGPDCLLGL